MRRFVFAVMMAALPFALCASEVDPTDKMAELGLTPDGQLLPPKVGFVVPATAQYILPIYDAASGEYTTLNVDVQPAKANATDDAASKVDALMGALLRADAGILSVGMTYDGTVLGAAKDAVVVRFTLPTTLTNFDEFATGDGTGIGGLVSDVVFANLGGNPVNGVGVAFRKSGASDYVTLEALAPAAFGIGVIDGPEMFDDDGNVDRNAPTQAAVPNELLTGGRPTGVLSGKSVYLNQGHGKVWRGTNNQYFSYQRGYLHNNQEDHSNADLMNQFTTPYMWAAGADTFSVRETDPNPNMVVVDNDDAASGNQYGFSKTGTWTASSVAGYKNGATSYVSGVNPHAQGTVILADCTTAATPTATATWAAQIPAAGYYNVYVSHVANSTRPDAQKYQVYHAGGVTDCTIHGKRYRNTWVQLGRFYFEKDAPATNAKVVVSNIGTATSQNISADAVRWGGGRGLISRGTAGTSGETRNHEEARYHLQFMGVPETGTYGYNSSSDESGTQVDERDGWSARPRFAKWMKSQGSSYGAAAQDSCLISCHTNALNGSANYDGSLISDGTARGFGTYRSTTTGFDNVAFQATVSPVIANLLRGVFSVSPGPITNRGLHSGAYGEANPDSAGMPVMLGEWLFHDNSNDMALYHHPRFKQMLGRGIQRGIINYWVSKGTIPSPAVYSPEPVTNLCVLQQSPTSVALTWGAPPTAYNGTAVASAATGYRIWQSEHGRAFPNSIATVAHPASGTPTYTVTGLTPGKTYYFKVSATNAGGESIGGDTLAVRTETAATAKKILIVQGFNKLDTATRINWSYQGGTMYRFLLDRLNSYDYIYDHARGIDAYCAQYSVPVKVDSCNKDSIEGSWVLLGGYDAVIWMSGLESEVCAWDCWNNVSIGAGSRTRIKAYLDTVGKAFFISGAEVAWEMASTAKNVDKTFLNDTLKTGFAADGAGTYAANAVAGGIFEGVTGAINFDSGSDWQRVGYQVQWPDVLTVSGGSTAALAYGSSSGTPIETFDALGTWAVPSYSGGTNVAAADCSRNIDTSVKTEGSGSMRINATWNAGNNIREYNTGTNTFTFTFAEGDTISYWVYGDNSNCTIRFCFGDEDGDLMYHPAVSINWTGWRQLSYKRGTDTFTRYAGSGDGVITGNTMKVNCFIWNKGASTSASNVVYIDDLRVLSGAPGAITVAAVQSGTASTSRIVYMGFPLEAVVSDSQRNAMMTRIVNFLLPQTTGVGSVRVNIEPAAAVEAGAKWRIAGIGDWNESGATVNNVAAGTQTIEFNVVGGKFTAPANVVITVTNDATVVPAASTTTYAYPADVNDWTQF